MRKIYVVGNATEYANWMGGALTNNIEDADLVLFTGGEDVHPSMYNEPMGSRTGANIARDRREKAVFDKAVALGKHIIGICRGSQFTCAMSGGRLVQDQYNPGTHMMKTSDGQELPITSTHHQAQFPYDMPEDKYKVLAYTEGISPRHLNGKDVEIRNEPFKEVEIGYYPHTKVLAIQGHPEYVWNERNSREWKPTFDYLTDLLDKHLEDKL